MASITDLRLGSTPADLGNAAGPMSAGFGLNVLAAVTGGGGPPVQTSFRHWRVLNLSSPTTGFAVVEIEMAATPGGADLCNGGTASAGLNGADSPNNAFDNNTSTRWLGDPNLVAGNWLQYDFGAPVEIGEVRITARSDFPNDAPRAFLFCGSDDGITFTAGQVFRTGSWTAGQQKAFTVDAIENLVNDRSKAFIWGITATASANGGRLYMAGMEMALSAGGADICTGGAGFHETILQTSEPSGNLFDGTNSLCAAKLFSEVAEQDFGYVFASPVDIAELRLTAASTFSLQANMVSAFSIWWSSNGFTKNTVASFSAQTGWGSGEERAYAVPS